MKISKIDILSVSTETGNAVFACRISPDGLTCFNANLYLSHLEAYASSGVMIRYRFLNGGMWSELPFVVESPV